MSSLVNSVLPTVDNVTILKKPLPLDAFIIFFVAFVPDHVFSGTCKSTNCAGLSWFVFPTFALYLSS